MILLLANITVSLTLQAGQTGLDTLRRMSKAGLNKAATTVVTSAIMVQFCVYKLTAFIYGAHECPMLISVPYGPFYDNNDAPLVGIRV